MTVDVAGVILKPCQIAVAICLFVVVAVATFYNVKTIVIVFVNLLSLRFSFVTSFSYQSLSFSLYVVTTLRVLVTAIINCCLLNTW